MFNLAFFSNTVINTIGSVDDLIEKNQLILNAFSKYLQAEYQLLKSSHTDNYIELGKIIARTGRLLKKEEWVAESVIDLSTMKTNEIFLSNFSCGDSFETNIKNLNPFDLVYGSIRPYFRKSGFSIDTKCVAGSVFSFKPKHSDYFLVALAIITSNDFHSFTEVNSQGTKMPIINWDSFITYKIPNFSNDQLEIFNKKVKNSFKICVNLTLQNRSLKKIKYSLLEKYFTNL